MAGLFPDYLFDPGSYSSLLSGLNKGDRSDVNAGMPPWLPFTLDNIGQGGNDMLFGLRPPQFANSGQAPMVTRAPALQQDSIPPTAQPASQPSIPSQVLPQFPQQAPQFPAAAPNPLSGFLSIFGNAPGADTSGGGPSFGDRLTAGLQGFANGGAPLPMIANLLTGLATGQRSDPQGILLQQQAATFRSLIASGVPPAMAKAAALNPEILKTIAGTYFETKPVETGVDPLTGRKSFGVYNPTTKTLTPLTYGQSSDNSSGNSIDDINKAVQAGVTGTDLYQYLPPAMRNTVQAMIEGRMPLPSTVAMRSPATQALINAANAIDPSFDATTWKARAQMATDLAKSTPASAGGQIQFARTSINHLADVAAKAEALKNWDLGISPLSLSANYLRGLTTDQAAKINALQAAVQHYGQEITKFYAGSPGGEAERARFLNSISAAKTPQELAAAIDAERQLIPGRLNELENRIGGTMGPIGASKYPVHSDESKASLDKIDQITTRMRSGGNTVAQPGDQGYTIKEGTTATNPQTKQRIIFRNGQWQPL